MTADCFLDTNLMLYAVSGHAEDQRKRDIASALIEDSDFGVSTQVLQEFIANALHRPDLGITEKAIDSFLELVSDVPVVPVTTELVISGTILRRRYRMSQWDSTMVAAALELGCKILYSEDFQHEQNIEGMEIINPFAW